MQFPYSSVLVLAFLASHSMAASFDCNKASNYAEVQICQDVYLSGLDEKISKSYKSALQARKDQKDFLRLSQREWLEKRNQCSSKACLDETINERIKTLDKVTLSSKAFAIEAEGREPSTLISTPEVVPQNRYLGKV